MTGQQGTGPRGHASSTGQALTGGGWLDVHFEMARPEYEAQLRAVGIQPGWHVLDAACGSGSFLPWLAELVGPSGALTALDLARDNVALVERRMQGGDLPCPVEVQAGTVLALPYPDASFDAVWLANSSQYLTDDELATTLAEFRRVVRPGGLVAIKDSDGELSRLAPGPPGVALRGYAAWAAAGSVQGAGLMRVPALPAWLRRAGFDAVWGRATLIERAAPLDPAAREYSRGLAAFGELLGGLGLPPDDTVFWAQTRDPAALERLLDDPNYWFIEGNLLTVGTVPRAGA